MLNGIYVEKRQTVPNGTVSTVSTRVDLTGNPTLPRARARLMKRVESKMSVLATIGSSTHEVPTKTMKRFGIAGLGEDVGDVVARANVVERQGIVNHRMMINKGVRDSKMAKAAKIPATTRDMNAPLIVFVDRGGRQIADVKISIVALQIAHDAFAGLPNRHRRSRFLFLTLPTGLSWLGLTHSQASYFPASR